MDYNKLARPLECHITRVTHKGQSDYYIRAIDDLPNGASRSFYLTDPHGMYLAFAEEETALAFCRKYRDLKIYPEDEAFDTASVIDWLESRNPADLAYDPMGRAFMFCEAATDCYDRIKVSKKPADVKRYLDATMISYAYYNCEGEFARSGVNTVPEFSEFQLKFITEVFENAAVVFDSMFRDRVYDESHTETVTPRVPSAEDMQSAMEQCDGVIQRAAKRLHFDMGYGHLSVANIRMCLQGFKPADTGAEDSKED